MKIRIRGNSIRMRLSRTEVDTLVTEGYIEERTEFNSGVLLYALQKKDGIDKLTADFTDNTITMYIPDTLVTDWNKNETVGFDNKLTLINGNVLSLLVEKDFKCIDSDTTEDQSDNFDNPSKSC